MLSLSRSYRTAALCAMLAIAGASAVSAHAGRLAARDTPHAARAAIGSPVVVKALAAGTDVVEYRHEGLDQYFITADPVEQAAVDGGAAGAYLRTGESFKAGGPNQVCRFYGNTTINPATGGIYGPNSHFYTADPQECAGLKAQFTPNAKSWLFESNDFATTPAVNGACPAGLTPVYRAYNNGFARGVDSNHRITANFAAYQQTVARGWLGEGIVMCAPAAAPPSILPAVIAGCSPGDCPAEHTVLGNGLDLVNLVVEIANTTQGPLQLVIPAGQTFTASDDRFQNGLAEGLQATIAAGTTGRFVLRLFCLNQNRDPSTAEASFAPGPITTNANLLDILSLAAGKLGPALDGATLKAQAVQLAVWEVTNGTGSLSAQGRDLFVALLAVAADDLLTQANLFQQFQATLTPPPL